MVWNSLTEGRHLAASADRMARCTNIRRFILARDLCGDRRSILNSLYPSPPPPLPPVFTGTRSRFHLKLIRPLGGNAKTTCCVWHCPLRFLHLLSVLKVNIGLPGRCGDSREFIGAQQGLGISLSSTAARSSNSTGWSLSIIVLCIIDLLSLSGSQSVGKRVVSRRRGTSFS